jgi:hypothetical protein
VRLASNDADENPFDITLTGTPLAPEADADGDRVSSVAEMNLVFAVLRVRRVAGLGTEFLDVADEALQGIVAAPVRWRAIEQDVRRYLLRRFPFAILYRVQPDHVRILAVKHHCRHLDYWRERMEG